MIIHLFSYKTLSILVFISSLFVPVTLNTNLVVEIDRDIEEWHLDLLASVQKQEGVELQPFATDGCSGGLSEAWSSFAEVFPAFKEKFGATPLWESCCVEHDRAYWQGEVEDGYNKRLEADVALRQCVIEYGKQNSEQLANKFSIDKQKIEKQFGYTAEFMYRAVRIGGKPCSFLPWRWGYGWPHCKLNPSPSDNPSSSNQ